MRCGMHRGMHRPSRSLPVQELDQRVFSIRLELKKRYALLEVVSRGRTSIMRRVHRAIFLLKRDIHPHLLTLEPVIQPDTDDCDAGVLRGDDRLHERSWIRNRYRAQFVGRNSDLLRSRFGKRSFALAGDDHFGIDDGWLAGLFVSRVIAHDLKCVLESNVGDENRADPIVN